MSATNPSKVGKTILDYLSRTTAPEVPDGFISKEEVASLTGFGQSRFKRFIKNMKAQNKVEYRLISVIRCGQLRPVAHYRFAPEIAAMMGLPSGRVGLPRGISRKSPMTSPRTTTTDRPTVRECKKRSRR